MKKSVKLNRKAMAGVGIFLYILSTVIALVVFIEERSNSFVHSSPLEELAAHWPVIVGHIYAVFLIALSGRYK